MKCNRFREDGSACLNETDNADGWCRQDGCPGFLRRDPAKAPITEGGPRGTSRHIAETGDVQLPDVTIEDVPTVRVATRTLDSFRFHHGGSEGDAEVQLRAMLEDFLLKSARSVSAGGYVRLAREGYVVTISPAGDTITGYSTTHRERTWEQVKAGVKSRFKRNGKARTASGPAPEHGPRVEKSDFHRSFDPASVHLTARVRTSFAKIAGLPWVTDEELDAAIRAACTGFASGDLIQRDDGCFEISLSDRTWLVTPDCLKLVGVKTTPKQEIPSRSALVRRNLGGPHEAPGVADSVKAGPGPSAGARNTRSQCAQHLSL